jgi:uncharacterized protein YkwD
MTGATRLLPLLMFALALIGTGCAVPLPAPELTATAEGLQPTPEPPRVGADVQSSSSGAPSNSTILERTSGDSSQTTSALAPLDSATPTFDEETPEPEDTPTPEPPTETPTPEDPTETPEPSATPEPTVDPATYPHVFLDLLNQHRVDNLIPALQFNETLAASATAYAEFMASNGFFGHYPPNGSTPAGRIEAAGFGGQYKGEALSAGQVTPEIALSRLLNSPEHSSILLNPTSTLVGIGYYYDPNSQYGHYWVVVTANP